MNHSEVQARMADYLEGHLALADRALVDAHLDSCRDCSAEVAEIRATIAALRSLPEPRVPGDFTSNVMRRIHAGDAAPGLFERLLDVFESLSSPRILVPLSAAALSVGLVLWGQQAGVLSVGHGHTGDRAPHPQDEVVASAGSLVRQAGVEAGVPNGVQIASLGPVTQPDSRGFQNAGALASSRASGDGPQAFSFQIVLNDGHRPPYVLDGSGGNFVLSPFRSDGAEAGDVLGRNAVAVSARSPLESVPGLGHENSASAPRSRADWLEVLDESPAEFATHLSRLSLAEQEIWIDRLARHAAEQGSLERVIARLQAAGGPLGSAIAEDFAGVVDGIPAYSAAGDRLP